MRTWQKSLAVLKNGNSRFIQNKVNNILHHDLELLSEAQNPYAVILCCSDSRVSPDIIFDRGLGDLFVIQNAGNVCDTSVFGSIQYAIQFLKTPLIIVLGHTGCGAVTAAHNHKRMKGPLQSIVSLIDKHIVDGSVLDSTENHTLETAKTLSSALNLHQDKFEQELKVIPAIYNISSGYISWMDIDKEALSIPDH